jgi:ribA/ribD-fused uncharacterized protein
MINNFSGQYRWLSNFAPALVHLDGIEYLSVEHAYQAAKSFDAKYRASIARCATPTDAKRLGRTVPLRTDWPQVKLAVMEDLLRQKFSQPFFATKLHATGNEELVEGNYWHDTFWGVCNGVGENHLGRLLMLIRDTP